jgi:uncharacterized membrane protein
MTDVLSVFLRWLHISSIATLIGGMIFGRLVMSRAADGLPADRREGFLDAAAVLFRPLMFACLGGVLISGLYNIYINLYAGAKPMPPLYHMLLGIKLLLAMHVFAVAILVARPRNPRRARMMAGAAISGLIVIAISAYLRSMHM